MRGVIAAIAVLMACGSGESSRPIEAKGDYVTWTSARGSLVHVPVGKTVSKLELEDLMQHWDRSFAPPKDMLTVPDLELIWPLVDIWFVDADSEGLFTDSLNRVVYGYEQYGHVVVGLTPHIWTGALSHEWVHAVGYWRHYKPWSEEDHKNWPQAFTDEVDAETKADMGCAP